MYGLSATVNSARPSCHKNSGLVPCRRSSPEGLDLDRSQVVKEVVGSGNAGLLDSQCQS